MVKVFRPLLRRADAGKLKAFDRVAGDVIRLKPNFTGGSHQVLFVLTRD